MRRRVYGRRGTMDEGGRWKDNLERGGSFLEVRMVDYWKREG